MSTPAHRGLCPPAAAHTHGAGSLLCVSSRPCHCVECRKPGTQSSCSILQTLTRPEKPREMQRFADSPSKSPGLVSYDFKVPSWRIKEPKETWQAGFSGFLIAWGRAPPAGNPGFVPITREDQMLGFPLSCLTLQP